MSLKIFTKKRHLLNEIFFKYRCYQFRLKMVEIDSKIKKEDIKKYECYLKKIDSVLEHMNPDSRFIIKERFIQNKPIQQIAASRSSCYRFLKASIKEFFALSGESSWL